jgi:4-carboxymuconolactone decarboxylase
MTNDSLGRTTRARREDGAQIVRRMFGQAFLDRTMGGGSQGEGAPAAMAGFALEHCYGDVWTRPGLSLRERSLVTLGILVAAGHPDELANHVLGARGNGLTREELAELALHSAPYVGFPAAGQAMGAILKAWADADTERSAQSPATVLRSLFAESDHSTEESFSRHWHEDAIYHGMGIDGVDRDFRGREAILGLLADTRDVMDEMFDRLVAVYPAGDDLAIAHVRAHRRAARTGETVDGDYALVAQVHNGLVVRGQGMPSADYRAFFRAQHEETRP